MTYGRVPFASQARALAGAAGSHSAELVRGDFHLRAGTPPHPPFGHLLPKGRRGRVERVILPAYSLLPTPNSLLPLSLNSNSG